MTPFLSQRAPRLRLQCVAALIWLAALATMGIGIAQAGEFHVYACNSDGIAAPFGAAYNSGSAYAGGGCPAPDNAGDASGLLARHTGAFGANGTYAYMSFTAPPNTSLNGISGQWAIENNDPLWLAGVQAGDGGWWAGGPLQKGLHTWGGWAPLNIDFGPGAPGVTVRFAVTCEMASGCGPHATPLVWSSGRNIDVRMTNYTRPNMYSYVGCIPNACGWMNTDPSGSFDTSDDVGVKTAWISVDGILRGGGNFSCDYHVAAPCPGAERIAATATGLVDGAHVWELHSVDTANNETATSGTLYIDKNAPAAPSDPVLAGTTSSQWRTANSFSQSWTNPAQGAGSALTAGDVQLCPVSSTTGEVNAASASCVVRSLSAGGASVATTMPAPGIWKARVRLKDALQWGPWGNWGPTLRFDNVAPAAPVADHLNGWLSDAEIRAQDFHIHKPNGVLPVSGIAGYAVTTNGSAPGTTVTAPAEQQTGSYNAPVDLSQLPEGTSTVTARAISGAGVPSAQSASEQVKIDRTAPQTVVTSAATEAWTNRAVEVSLKATDALSGMTAAAADLSYDKGAYSEYEIDGGATQQTRGAEATISIDEPGAHIITMRAVDVAGNRSETKTVRRNIDRIGPTVTMTRTDGKPMGNDAWSNKPVVVDIDAQDAAAGMTGAAADQALESGGYIEYTVDSGAPQKVRGGHAQAQISGTGTHTFGVRAFDAAGNPSSAEAKTAMIKIDDKGPEGGLLPSDANDPRLIRFYVSEDCIASASVQIKGDADADWRTLPSTVTGSTLSARVPDDLWESRGNYAVRAIVSDCAGNTSILDHWWSGQNAGRPIGIVALPARIPTVLKVALSQGALANQCVKTKKTILMATKVREGHKKPKHARKVKQIVTLQVCPDGKVTQISPKPRTTKKSKRTSTLETRSARTAKVKAKPKPAGTLTVPATVEQPKKLYGSLMTPDGQPVANAPVDVEIKIKGTSEWKRLSATKTDTTGQLSASIPTGPSRTLRLSYYHTDDLADAQSELVDIKVKAASTIKALAAKAKNGQWVRFTGRVLGGNLPAGGYPLTLEGYNPIKKKWIPVAARGLKADPKTGKWQASYHFTATTGKVTYKFRLSMPGDVVGAPWEAATTGIVRVEVTGNRVRVRKTKHKR
jgi:hypothetical protein